MLASSKHLAALAMVGLTALTGCSADDFTSESTGNNTDSASTAEQGTEANGSVDPATKQLLKGVRLDATSARQTLDVLPVTDPASMAGYSREKFPHWRAVSDPEFGWQDTPDAKGCDAREVALYRDGENVEVNPNTCTVKSGTWTDPYTGKTVTDPHELDIDHMVPLANAYRSGANKWDENQGTIYANSSESLVSSDSSANREKGDQGPETWKPENKGAWCGYAIRWVGVKSDYGLNLTSQGEKDALGEMIDTCPAGV